MTRAPGMREKIVCGPVKSSCVMPGIDGFDDEEFGSAMAALRRFDASEHGGISFLA